MSTVISIRVKKEVKELMSLVNINWRKEIEDFIRKKALEELRKDMLSKAKENLKLMREIDNVKIIREERERD